MKDEWTQVASRVVYANPWVRFTEDDIERSDGSTATYAVMHAHDYAIVIPFDGERYHLVEQFRYPIGRRVWEFPQGAMPGEQPEHAYEIAETELREETGLTATSFTKLGYLHDSYGRSTIGFHVFLATGLTEGQHEREESEQDMQSAWFTIEQIWSMIGEGSITDASTVSAIALLEHHRSQGR